MTTEPREEPREVMGTGSPTSGGLKPELVEHRLDQLETTTKEIRGDVSSIKTDVTEIKTTIKVGMATKKELMYIALGLVGTIIVHVVLRYFKI